jgi:hypothetical protein
MPPPTKRPAAIQPRKESLAPKLASTATGREASAFMATTDQVPLRTPQVRVCVPVPCVEATQKRCSAGGVTGAASAWWR